MGTHFILAATQKIIDEKPEIVTGLLAALVAGEKVVKSDPPEAHAAVSRVLGGTLKPEDVASASKNYNFNMKIEKAMLDLMVDEGLWINERGSIKGDAPTAGSIRPYIEGSFLAGIDASRVTLK